MSLLLAVSLLGACFERESSDEMSVESPLLLLAILVPGVEGSDSSCQSPTVGGPACNTAALHHKRVEHSRVRSLICYYAVDTLHRL